MPKQQTPGLRDMQKTLSLSAFAPGKPGPLRIIADVQNPDYYELRAMEMVKEANSLMKEPLPTVELNDGSHENVTSVLAERQARYDKLITESISLLALAKLYRLR